MRLFLLKFWERGWHGVAWVAIEDGSVRGWRERGERVIRREEERGVGDGREGGGRTKGDREMGDGK